MMGAPLRRICVFCGSSSGGNPEYRRVARGFGVALAENDLSLIYGGGSAGLMGELARSVLRCGGQVIGVIPRRIQEMAGALELTELHVVENMHERKALMYELGDAFVVLPGGIGTIEELFEVFTWYQLGIHLKPIGLLNIRGYFDKLLDFVQHMVGEGFLKSAHSDALVIEDRAGRLISGLRDHEPRYVDKLG